MAESDSSGPRLPEDIFNDALELDPRERAAWLTAACGGDDGLRSLIEEMLVRVDRDPCLVLPPVPAVAPKSIGKYEVLRECGRGGMGVVYAARDTDLDRIVALKLLSSPLARSVRARERFAREARLLAALSDPRIAMIHSLEEIGGHSVLVMEYIDGRTLADTLKKGPLPIPEALRVGEEIAHALALAHARRIVHRDLKPGNVMIESGGAVKVLDFGIAKAFGDDDPSAVATERPSDAQTLAVGTPGYMAPEQLAGGPVDHRCDLWALGTVLSQCLTGRRPDRCASMAAPRATRSDDRPVSSSEPLVPPAAGRTVPDAAAVPLSEGLPKGVPKQVRALMARCLAADPDQREASAENAAKILAHARRHLASRRRRLGAYAAVLVGAPLLAAALFLAHHSALVSPHPIAAVVQEGAQRVRALDEAGDTVWNRVLPRALALAPLAVRTDSGVAGVGLVLSGQASDRPDAVQFLRPTDGSALWTWESQWKPPINHQGRLTVRSLWTVPWVGEDATAIAVVLRDGGWYGSALQFLSLSGRPLGTYYHPGPIGPGLSFRSEPDSTSRILLWGLNSSARFVSSLVPFDTRVHCGAVILLEPPRVSGQAFPYSEGLPGARDWPGMPRAHEAAYLVIPPLHPMIYAGIAGCEVAKDTHGARTIRVQLTDGRNLMLDSNLRPEFCFIGTGGQADSLRLLGEARFLPVLWIRDGVATMVDVEVRL